MTLKQSTINVIATTAFFLMALLLGGSVYFADQAIQEEHQVEAQHAKFKQLGIELAEASQYLTEEVRKFAISGNIKHLENYWKEIEVTKTRDNVLTHLKELKAPPEIFDLLKLAKQNSDALIATETRAMRLVFEAQGLLKSSMHQTVAAIQLSDEEIKLSAEDKIQLAREILFDVQYEAYKHTITKPIVQFQNQMDAQAARQIEAARHQTETTILVLVIIVFMILMSIGTVLWFFQTQFSIPITKYISELQERDATVQDFALTPTGTQELRSLAKAFNQQFLLNQQQLKQNQQLIEDIVQVSQGLAQGNLHIMPKAEYQGEFAQIKNALETILTIQRQVIEDIVKMSNGLAQGNLHVVPQAEYRGDFRQIKNSLETTLRSLRQIIEDTVKMAQEIAKGNWHVIPQAEYQGDFVQIKNALQSTAAQLAETTAQNTEQNWLKTGQTELNQKMRGEQNLIILTQNIINQLAAYLNAQVGVFFLAEGDCFKLVSSYAYKQRNNNYNQFKLGEGLIGQAALEKKSIVFSQAPQEHINLSINSGMGESPPHDIFVLPLIYENQVMGVLELATSRQFTPIEIELLDGVADNIAISLHTAQSRLRMQALLEESQQLTRTLQTQQQEVLESEKRIRAIVDTIIDAVITIDQRGIIESFNKAAEQIFGYHKSEVIGQNIKILMPEPYHSQHDQYLADYFNTGHAKLIGKVRELTGQRKDGSVFPIEISLAEIQIGDQYIFTGIVRDITKRKQAENVLQEQQEELRTANEELQTQSEELQVQQEELRQTNEELEERTKELERQTNEILQKNFALKQNQVEMEKAKAALETKAQELQLASQYKSEFLANMSHELRTPLNSLLILAQLLAQNKPGNLDDKQVEYARTIHSAGADLLTLINDILDLSKVEAGKIEIHPEELLLTDLVETIEQKFRHLAEEKGLAFHISVADDLPLALHTDVQRLQQIINNLLSNAFKFTEKGEIKLEIKSKYSQREISISVTDTGIGIPKDKQQVIFKAFQQADGSTSRRYGGTGLGLSISRQLAILLGGELTLDSEKDKGSTFTVNIPTKTFVKSLKPSGEIAEESGNKAISKNAGNKDGINDTVAFQTAQPTAEMLQEIADDRANLTKTDKSFLIIEDDRKFSSILIELAREKQFKCIIAEDGKTGLQLAEQYQPNAIILDIGLPQLDGWTVMERLKDNPETRHIPVHFMSASDESRLDAKKMGAIGYLLKPVNMEELGDAFKKIEQFLASTVKNLLVIADNKAHQQKILGLIGSSDIQITLATTVKSAAEHLHRAQFDCIILDVEIEQGTCLKLLEELQHKKNLSQIPVIIYAERELLPQEETLLQRYADNLTVKTVRSPERLLDEATLFLHQVEANLSAEKRKMLQMVHDKTAILRHKKVLIVDDDMRNTFALMTVLEDNDMVVLIAENGKEAIESLTEHEDIAIVLMDIMMPEMDGYEAIQQIRKHPHHRQLPIIALTAKAMKGDKAKCIEAGANDYLSKPVDTDKLISLMRVWLYR
jgi:PAS domain S-box-containing protein